MDRLSDSLLPQRTKYLLQFGKSVNSFLAKEVNNSDEGPAKGSVSIRRNHEPGPDLPTYQPLSGGECCRKLAGKHEA